MVQDKRGLISTRGKYRKDFQGPAQTAIHLNQVNLEKWNEAVEKNRRMLVKLIPNGSGGYVLKVWKTKPSRVAKAKMNSN